MKIVTKSLGFIALMLCSQWALAQFTATGTITDGSGEPLIGASVQVEGTQAGTTTDIDGKFSLDVPGNSATLVVSYLGFTTQEVDVSRDASTVNITLEEESTVLNEVVIVGYGETTKEKLTGSVSKLRSDKLESVPLGSVEQTLQGNVAGLQSVMGNGQPGANVQVRIRGQGSISASSDPLYVIDGIPVASGSLTTGGDGDIDFNAETNNPLATINPNDIASVTVLKDASATAIYGSRGANGVILITTKSGAEGKAKIDFRTQIGFNNWAVPKSRQLRGLTAREYTELYFEGYANRGEELQTTLDRFNTQFPGSVDFNADGSIQRINTDTRWIEELSRTGLNQSYDLSVNGGNKAFTYFVSASYFDQEAPIIYSKMDRLSTRVNLAVNVTDRLRVTNNLTISKTDQQGMNDATRWANPLYNGYLLAPVIPLRDEQGRFYGDHQSFFMGGNNPVGSLSGDDEQMWSMNRILNNLSATYEITSGLKFKTAWSLDLTGYDEFYFRNGRYGDGRNDDGYGSEASRNINNWIGTQTLNYDKSFGSHNVGGLLGYESQKSSTRSAFAAAIGYPNPNLRTLASAANPDAVSSSLTEWSFQSVFGQLNYNYNYKYYLSASVRRDGSSRFGVDNRFGTFWSVGASWRLDQEGFIQNVGWIQELKLRSSYGVTGNAGIGDYEAIGTFTFSGVDYDGQPGGQPGNIGNQALTWERAKQFNIGLDFGLFQNLTGVIEYFDRESDNLLLDVPISRTTGFETLTQNFGSMRNSGVELTLDYGIINRDDFRWSVGGNITFLKNEITKLQEEFISGTKIRREGSDFNTFYLFDWVGVDPQTGGPQWYVDESRSEITSSASEADRFATGQRSTPDFFGGFNTNIGFKGLSIDAQFTYSWGNHIYDNTAWVLQGDGRFTPRSQTNLVLNRWRQPGDVTDVPQFVWGNTTSSNLRPSSRYIFDGSHVRLRNLTVAYNLPSSLISNAKLRSARVYVRGINLLTFTKDPDLYLDPEAAISGVVNSPVPNLKTISFGLDLGL